MTSTEPVTLVALDLTPASVPVLQSALQLAEEGELHAVYVLGGYDPMGAMQVAYESHKLNVEREQGELEAFLTEHAGEAARSIRTHVVVGSPAQEILHVARKLSPKVIVMGTHGRKGLKRLLLGSVAEEVLRHATCQVIVVRPNPPSDG